MWKQLFELIKQLLSLTKDVQQTLITLKELQKEVKDLSEKTEQKISGFKSSIEELKYEIKHLSMSELAEREKVILQVENNLLRFERRLLGVLRSTDGS